MKRVQAYSGLLLGSTIIGFGYLTGIAVILVAGIVVTLLSVGIIMVIAGRHEERSENESGSILHDFFYGFLELVEAVFRF